MQKRNEIILGPVLPNHTALHPVSLSDAITDFLLSTTSPKANGHHAFLQRSDHGHPRRPCGSCCRPSRLCVSGLTSVSTILVSVLTNFKAPIWLLRSLSPLSPATRPLLQKWRRWHGTESTLLRTRRSTSNFCPHVTSLRINDHKTPRGRERRPVLRCPLFCEAQALGSFVYSTSEIGTDSACAGSRCLCQRKGSCDGARSVARHSNFLSKQRDSSYIKSDCSRSLSSPRSCLQLPSFWLQVATIFQVMTDPTRCVARSAKICLPKVIYL